ncbi:MAG: hypothetical protein FWH28_06000 [Clostridiales bacterium]|nr:hypothetical protein [Clostridiales bacterium]
MSIVARIKALEEDKGIQYLLDAAYEILQNPIAMFDTTYALQAFTDVSTDDPLWNELIASKTFSMETQAFFANECFTEEVANTDKVVILKSDKLAYDRILGNIFSREQIKVSNIIMVGCKTPLGDEAPEAIMELADKISSIISEDEYFIAFGRASHQTIINNLLDGVIRDPLIYTPHVQIIYEGFDDYLYIAVVGVPPKENQQESLEYFYGLLMRTYPIFKFAVYGDYIIMLISSKHSQFDETMFFDMQNNPFRQHGLFAGISASFENLYELHEYYDKAVAALKKGLAGNDGRHFFYSV